MKSSLENAILHDAVVWMMKSQEKRDQYFCLAAHAGFPFPRNLFTIEGLGLRLVFLPRILLVK